MNGNDEPRACAACKLVFEHQNAAAHSCKQCKLPVHSWVACDMVWMPEEGEYFWQAVLTLVLGLPFNCVNTDLCAKC